MTEPVRVLKVDGRDPTDAIRIDVRRRDLLTERQRREYGQLRTRVIAIDIGGGIGLRVAKSLRLGEYVRKGGAAALDLGKDEVRCPVQNAIKRGDAIAG